MTAMNRRHFLTRAAALGCSAAASPVLTPVTMAAMPGDHRLVVIILRGAMDGLDLLRPADDPHFAKYRPSLAATALGDGLALSGQFRLHPALDPLASLWASGDLAFAHAVSTPYRDKRSHFDGQDVLEAGTGQDVDATEMRDGWLNRLLQVMPAAHGKTAFAVGRSEMRLLSGDAPISSWSPESRIDLSPQARLLLDQMYHDDPLFRTASQDAFEIAESLGVAGTDSFALSSEELRAEMHAQRNAGQSATLAEFSARRLREDARIVAFSLSGWDTHRQQARGMDRALSQLSDAILTLQRDLGPVWERTTVLAMTEFGRTVRENGTQGTDHGTAGTLMMAGGALNGGRLFGIWPGLGERDLYQGRDLMPTRDVRAYPAWIMHACFGVDRAKLESVVFPGLDMESDPGMLS